MFLLFSGLALAKVRFLFTRLAVSEANFLVSCDHLWLKLFSVCSVCFYFSCCVIIVLRCFLFHSHPQIPASARLQHFDPDKNILFLLKELDSLRELNNKVSPPVFLSPSMFSFCLVNNSDKDPTSFILLKPSNWNIWSIVSIVSKSKSTPLKPETKCPRFVF